MNTLRSEFILTQPQPAATRHHGAMLCKETHGIQEGGNMSVLEAVFGLGAKKIRETFHNFDHWLDVLNKVQLWNHLRNHGTVTAVVSNEVFDRRIRE